jgi:hypothetical protein
MFISYKLDISRPFKSNDPIILLSTFRNFSCLDRNKSISFNFFPVMMIVLERMKSLIRDLESRLISVSSLRCSIMPRIVLMRYYLADSCDGIYSC